MASLLNALYHRPGLKQQSFERGGGAKTGIE